VSDEQFVPSFVIFSCDATPRAYTLEAVDKVQVFVIPYEIITVHNLTSDFNKSW
jgi:hypothetical protein